MNRMRRRKFEVMPLSKLRRLRDELQILVSELENGPRREIDIATAHTGDPALIDQVLRIIGDETRSSRWVQVERILCSLERCPNCPHGEFLYEYQKNRKSGTTKVSFKGIPFSQQALDNLRFYEFTEDGNSIKILPLGAEGEKSK